MEENQTRPSHKVYIHNRRGMKLSGVNEVVSFDAQEVLLETEQGSLLIQGSELHVSRLSVEKGELDVDGKVDALQYSDRKEKKRESFWRRWFV